MAVTSLSPSSTQVGAFLRNGVLQCLKALQFAAGSLLPSAEGYIVRFRFFWDFKNQKMSEVDGVSLGGAARL